MKNKKIIIIVSIVLVLILAVSLIFIFSKETKKYDTVNIEGRMVDWYDNMRLMDFVDSTNLFGIDMTVEEDAAFLTTYEDEITTETIIIVVINSKDTDEYYDFFKSFLDARKAYTDDIDLLNYYDKAKLVQTDNYIYFLLGPETDMYENELESFYY
jgi:hypothetical protein